MITLEGMRGIIYSTAKVIAKPDREHGGQSGAQLLSHAIAGTEGPWRSQKAIFQRKEILPAEGADGERRREDRFVCSTSTML